LQKAVLSKALLTVRPELNRATAGGKARTGSASGSSPSSFDGLLVFSRPKCAKRRRAACPGHGSQCADRSRKSSGERRGPWPPRLAAV